MFVHIVFVLLGLEVCTRVEGITCYICESYRDFRCLDPFDYQPFVQVQGFYVNDHVIFLIFQIHILRLRVSLRTFKLSY